MHRRYPLNAESACGIKCRVTEERNATRGIGYIRIEPSRAGRRACTKARATACSALVERYALCYAFPKN